MQDRLRAAGLGVLCRNGLEEEEDPLGEMNNELYLNSAGGP